MNSKQRVLTALNHEEPDRVPLQVDFTPEAAEKLSGAVELGDQTIEAYSGKISDLPLVMGHDLLVGWHGIATSYYLHPEQESYTCEWGIRWHWVNIPGGRYTEMIKPPLLEKEDLDNYECPNPDYQERYRTIEKLVKKYGESHAIVGAMPCTTFEACWYLRGMERFLVDLISDDDFSTRLISKVMDFQLATGSKLAQMGVDIIWMGDDFGTQNSLILAPETWRKYFKPCYRKLIETFKGINPELKIAYHSDGNVEPLLPEFIEVGVDILNAVQPKAMKPERLKEKFGDKLSFWGAVDIQEILPHGSPEQVEEEVKYRIDTLGVRGGYILAPSHNIQPDVPIDNILAFYRAAKKHGKYPLDHS
jgi:uroporphyrinogen decarboxylase